MTDKEFIKIKQLSKNFEDVTAVDDVTVNIAKGEFFYYWGLLVAVKRLY